MTKKLTAELVDNIFNSFDHLEHLLKNMETRGASVTELETVREGIGDWTGDNPWADADTSAKVETILVKYFA